MDRVGELRRTLPAVGKLEFDPHATDLEVVVAGIVDCETIPLVQLGDCLRREGDGRIAPDPFPFIAPATWQGTQRDIVHSAIRNVLPTTLKADALKMQGSGLCFAQVVDGEVFDGKGSRLALKLDGPLVQRAGQRRFGAFDSYVCPTGPIAIGILHRPDVGNQLDPHLLSRPARQISLQRRPGVFDPLLLVHGGFAAVLFYHGYAEEDSVARIAAVGLAYFAAHRGGRLFGQLQGHRQSVHVSRAGPVRRVHEDALLGHVPTGPF